MRTNHLLSALPDSDFQHLAPSLRMVPLTPRHVVAKEGEPCQAGEPQSSVSNPARR